ncbi:hypothetical protein D3C71_1712450 [compost metagenome]
MHLIYESKTSREDPDPEVTLLITCYVVWKPSEIVSKNIGCSLLWTLEPVSGQLIMIRFRHKHEIFIRRQGNPVCKIKTF